MKHGKVWSTAALVAVALVSGSCQQRPPAASAPPELDFSAAHRQVLSLLPSNAILAISVGKLGHLFDRLRAAQRIATAGPIGKRYLDAALVKPQTELGFDPLADAGWQGQGLDLEGPVGFAYLPGDKGILLFPTTDASKAATFLKSKLQQEELRCEPSEQGRKWVVCHDLPELPLVKQVDQSLFATAGKQIDAETLRLGLLVFTNLEGVPGVKDAPLDYFKQSKAAWLGVGSEPHVARWRGGYLNPDTASVQPYFTTDAPAASTGGAASPAAPTLLGALRGSDHFVLRAAFNPKAVWQFAKGKIPPEDFDKALAGFTLVTGLDADKDIVGNFTGELAMSVTSNAIVTLFGVRDAAVAGKLVERIDGLIGTALQAAPSGLQITRSQVELLGKKVYAYKGKIEIPNLDPIELAVHVTTGSGALVLAFDEAGAKLALQRLQDGAGKGKDALLAGLPSAVQPLFATPRPFAAYMAPSYLSALGQGDLMKRTRATYAKLGPDQAKALEEYIGVWMLIFDSAFEINLQPNGVFASGWMNLL